MLTAPDFIIYQSLNLKQFNLTQDQEQQCIDVFKEFGRQKALDHAKHIQEQKLYNSELNTFDAKPNKHQLAQYKKLSADYKIIIASIDKQKLITAHVYCEKTSYYYIATISAHQHAAFKEPYKYYDFTKHEPHLKILAPRPVNKKHKPKNQQLT